MNPLNRCGGCEFFRVDEFFRVNVDPKLSGVDGTCCFFPPQLVVHPDARGNAVIRSAFPMVGRAQSCGQYRPEGETTQ